MIIDLEQIVAAALAPCEGDNPAGENARYDKEYEEAQGEIRKLTAMTAGEGGVDWDLVVKNCAALLDKRTKDLNLAAYLTLALLKLEGYQGLAAGLDIINGYMGDLWPSVYPPAKRMKARANLFQWLDDRIAEAVGAEEPDGSQAEAVRKSFAAAQEMAKTVAEKVDVPVTGLSDLRAALKKWADNFPETETETETEPEPEPEQAAGQNEPAQTEAKAPPGPQGPAPAAPAATAAPAAGHASFTPPGDVKTGEEALDALDTLVNQMRGLNPASPLPYSLARVAKWGQLDTEPQSDGSGQTMVPGPRGDEAESFKLMAASSNWADLAEEAESRFLETGGAFWLDLQRLVAQALKAQGFNQAASVVAEEAGRLAARLPGLSGLSFVDGRPFADGATLEWLEEAKAAAAPAGSGSPSDSDLTASWRKEAVAKAGEGDLAGGLGLVQKAVDEAPGVEYALKRKLMAAELCLNYGRAGWAVPILEAVALELEGITLKAWAPKFCARVWAGLVRAYQGMAGELEQPDQKMEKRLDEVRRELFETDLALAAKLSQPDN